MTTTRADLRQRIGKAGFAGDMFLGTASANGAIGGTTLVDTKLTYPDDTLNNCEVVISSGAALGDYRWVLDWAQGTGTLTPDRAFSAQVLSAVSYEVHRKFSATRKNEAIAEAIRAAGFRWPRKVEDTSLTLIANTYTYALAGLSVPVHQEKGIASIEYDTGASGTGTPYALLDDDDWYVRDNDGVLTLQLKDIPKVGAGLRLTYWVRPAVLSDDTAALKPNSDELANYIVAKATSFLFEKAAADAGETEKGDNTKMMNYFNQLADGWLSKDSGQPQPGKVRLWDMDGNNNVNNFTVGRIRP